MSANNGLGDGPPPAKRVKSVAEMTASERRREAEIVAKRIDYHERKLGDLRGRHEELLAGLPDEEMGKLFPVSSLFVPLPLILVGTVHDPAYAMDDCYFLSPPHTILDEREY